MGLEYDDDQVFMVCDHCGEMSEGEHKDEFGELISKRRSEGWRTGKERGQWVNKCPNCSRGQR